MKRYNFYSVLVFYFSFFFLAMSSSQAQNCYVKMDDASGFDVSPYQAVLEAKACELKTLFDTIGYLDSFKVFSYGFYLELEKYDDYSFPTAFLDIKTEVEQQSPYYLLIAKQSDQSGIYTKFWLDMKLPETGIFSCIDDISEDHRAAISNKTRLAINSEYSNNGENPFYYQSAEIAGIDTLKSLLTSIASCCDPENRSPGSCGSCVFSYDEMIDFLNLKEFIKFPISIDPQYVIDNLDCSSSRPGKAKNDESSQLKIMNSIISYINYPISIDGENVLLDTLLSGSIPPFGNGEISIKITDFNNVLDNSFYGHFDEMINAGGGMIYFVDNSNSNTFLYVSPTNLEMLLQYDQPYIEEVFQDIALHSSCSGCPDWMLEIWNNDFSSTEGSMTATVIVPAIPAAAADGPIPLVDAILAAAAVAVIAYDIAKRTFLTYTAYNPALGQHYCGRTSGWGSVSSILANRIRVHHAVTLGFDVDYDRWAQGYPVGYWLVRGREQQLIDFYGGALSDSARRPTATSINAIRGVSKYNPNGYLYHYMSSGIWGELYPYTGTDLQDINSAFERARRSIRDWFR